MNQQFPVITVSEYNTLLNNLVSGCEVIVEGEIAALKIWENKYVYITLQDSTSTAQVFGSVRGLNNVNILETGMNIRVYGRPNVHERTGKLSLYAHDIALCGEGALKIAFKKLYDSLTREGLFAEERKRALPRFPERIGLITARDSQAFKDVIKILKQRFGAFTIYFTPVQVQGIGAPVEIVNAFSWFNHHTELNLDLLLLCRGGGSLEDLQTFNSEEVARAVFGSIFPVVSGVGHEGDITLADLASDLRASTPSNAAELISRDRRNVTQSLSASYKIMKHALDAKVTVYKEALHKKKDLMTLSLENSLHIQKKNFSMMQRLFFSYDSGKIVVDYHNMFQNNARRLLAALSSQMSRRHTTLLMTKRLFYSFNIQNVLDRGFSLVQDSNGKIVRNVSMLRINQRVKTQLAQGSFTSLIDNTTSNGSIINNLSSYSNDTNIRAETKKL